MLDWLGFHRIDRKELKISFRGATMTTSKSSFVVCLENPGYPASRELRKIYRTERDPGAEADRFLRVIDEAGESYLYPSRFFAPVSVP